MDTRSLISPVNINFKSEDEKDKVLQDLINRAEDAKFEYNPEYISPNPPTPGQWS